jgi:hypothetical protein
MENIIEIAGIAGAIGLSFGLALGLHWMVLAGLMRLMPGQIREVRRRETLL